jgi:hypothetical protein
MRSVPQLAVLVVHLRQYILNDISIFFSICIRRPCSSRLYRSAAEADAGICAMEPLLTPLFRTHWTTFSALTLMLAQG